MSSAAHPQQAWRFEEARRIVQERRPGGDRPVLFETGFGPSGLPYIGTFAEVARTTWVRHAFAHLTGLPTRLVAFSDDMDGLRKVPLNVPEPEMLAPHLGMPLHAIPDPFGECESQSGQLYAGSCSSSTPAASRTGSSARARHAAPATPTRA